MTDFIYLLTIFCFAGSGLSGIQLEEFPGILNSHFFYGFRTEMLPKFPEIVFKPFTPRYQGHNFVICAEHHFFPDIGIVIPESTAECHQLISRITGKIRINIFIFFQISFYCPGPVEKTCIRGQAEVGKINPQFFIFLQNGFP